MVRILPLVIVGACAQIANLGPERELTSSGAGGAAGSGAVGTGGAGACGEGPILWALQLGDASGQLPRDVVADTRGGVWASGVFQGEITFESSSIISTGQDDIFLARFDAAGRHQASRTFGDPLVQESATRLAPTSDGGVIMAGTFRNTVDLGDGPHAADAADAFVARYDASANYLWSHIYGGLDDQKTLAVAVHPQTGEVAIGGHFNRVINFGEGVFTTNQSDGFLAKLSAEGMLVWSRAIAAPGTQYVNAVAFTAEGHVLFGGSTTAAIDLGLGEEPTTGGNDTDAFVALYDGDGQAIWAHVYDDSPGAQSIKRVAVAPDGRVVVAGECAGTFDLGMGHVLTSGHSFVASLDAAASTLLARSFDNVPDTPSLAVDAAGAVLLGTRFEGTTNMGAGPVDGHGGTDGLIVKLEPTLDHRWTQTIASVGDDDARAVTADGAGNVYSLVSFRDTVWLENCGQFTSRGLDTDLLLVKLAP